MSGSWMSSRTTSGRSSRAAATPARPSAASPTTSKPPEPSSRRTRARKPAWSSTISRVGRMASSSQASGHGTRGLSLLGGQGQPLPNPRAAPPAGRGWAPMPPHPAGPKVSSRHRQLVARHPVAAFLCICYAVNWATAVPWFRTRTDVLPFDLPMWGSLGTFFGVALAAVLVVAATDGTAGVRDLARRSLRWRVGVRWYLVAVLGLPVAVLMGAVALFGS